MGNTASGATCLIRLNSPGVYAGSALSGSVYLSVSTPIDAQVLQICISGKEYSHVHWTTTRSVSDGNGGTRSETDHHHAYASRRLIDVTMPLATYPARMVSPGFYEHPFVAPLPVGLPSSMCASGGGGDCSISYKVSARLSRPGMFSWDVRAETPFVLCAVPLMAAPFPYYAQPSTRPITVCCCIPRGRATLGAAVDDTLAARGQTLGVNIAMRNESTVQPERLFVAVTEFVRWSAGGHSNTSQRTVALSEFDPRTVAGFSRLSDDEAKQLSPGSGATSAGVLYEMHARLQSGTNRTPLTIDPSARDTYAGGVLSTSHGLSLRVKMPCCVSDATVEAPLRICE